MWRGSPERGRRGQRERLRRRFVELRRFEQQFVERREQQLLRRTRAELLRPVLQCPLALLSRPVAAGLHDEARRVPGLPLHAGASLVLLLPMQERPMGLRLLRTALACEVDLYAKGRGGIGVRRSAATLLERSPLDLADISRSSVAGRSLLRLAERRETILGGEHSGRTSSPL